MIQEQERVDVLYCRELGERVLLNLQLKSITASRRSAAAGFKLRTSSKHPRSNK